MRIAMIIAFKGFRDEEYFTPRKIFEDAGAEVKVVSDDMGIAMGADGGDALVNIKLGELKVLDFDAIVFIGGPGVPTRLDNDYSYIIAKQAVQSNKVLAAICITPAILAKAGVLRGKKATVWTNVANKEPEKVLKENDAIYQDQDVVQDGNIITCKGVEAAEQFARKVLEALKK